MLFNSVDFLVFILIIFALLLIVKTNLQQKFIYLIGSYIFYMWWNPYFILLLLFSTGFNYFIGKGIFESTNAGKRKALMVMGVVINLGVLGFFKYYNFFENNLFWIANRFGNFHSNYFSINVILPIGISFFTFEAIGYVIDIYLGKFKPTEKIIDFAIFIAFFPRLLAGPIMRADAFIPQLKEKRQLDFSKENLLLIYIGFFKKVIIADNLSVFADAIFTNPSVYPSVSIWIASICFAIQIYCDFSGYTDMAIGIAKVLGFSIPMNFNKPYAALTPSDFWTRWHISLSTWLRDYLYIPLGGNRKGKILTYRNLMLTMLIGGLWHGASWNFVLWGALHGILLCFYRVLNIDKFIFKANNFYKFIARLVMIYFILVTWITFRVTDFSRMVISLKKFIIPDMNFDIASIGFGKFNFFSNIMLIIIFIVIHIYSYRVKSLENRIAAFPNWALMAFIFISTIFLYFFIPSAEPPFIYFRF